MRPAFSLLSCVVALFLLAPLIQAETLAANQVYNCSNGFLEINRTSIISGAYQELFFDNQSCGSLGCAYNGIECNSPMNVDRLGSIMAAFLFLVAGVLFFVFGDRLKEVNRLYYAMKYLNIFVGFSMILLGILIVWGSYSMGQNQMTDTFFVGLMILLGNIIVTGLVLLIHEFQEFIKRLMEAGRSI